MNTKIIKFLQKINLLEPLRLFKDRHFRSSELVAFDERLFKFYSGILKSNYSCFDIGASYGYRTEAFLRIGASVVAVEPQKSVAKFLKKKFGNNIIIIQKALGSKVEKRTMYLNPSSVLSSLSLEWIDGVKKNQRFENSDWDKKDEVEVTTLDNLINLYGRPDFCKIDVEGFELEVLKGLSQPIPIISFEITVPEFIDNAIACVRYLQKLGNIICNFSQGETLCFYFSVWQEPDEFIEKFRNLYNNGVMDGDIYIKFLDTA